MPRAFPLCSTCNHNSFCFYQAMLGFDAQNCDLHDGAAEVGRGAARGESSDGNCWPDLVLPDPSSTPKPFKGLCINCDNRNVCALPRPDEGVWHCEEYQ